VERGGRERQNNRGKHECKTGTKRDTRRALCGQERRPGACGLIGQGQQKKARPTESVMIRRIKVECFKSLKSEAAIRPGSDSPGVFTREKTAEERVSNEDKQEKTTSHGVTKSHKKGEKTSR